MPDWSIALPMLSNRTISIAATSLALTAFALSAWQAWVCDDAYITFRVADNVVNGFGLRFNVDERVQAFTNVLWLWLLLPLKWLWRDQLQFVSAVLVLSLLLSAVAIGCLMMLARTPGARMLVGTTLLASKTFVDFATSGLETPLTVCLLAALMVVAVRASTRVDRTANTFLLAAALLLDRLDLMVLIAPYVVHVAICAGRNQGWRATGRQLVLAGLPLVLWFGFATIYYGTPLPNTFYAKVGVVDQRAIVIQGLYYLFNAVRWDPAMVATIACGMIVGWRRGGDQRALAIGIASHVSYVIWVGGDFMSGRFLLPAFVISLGLCALAAANWSGSRIGLPLAVAAMCAILPRSPIVELLWPTAASDYADIYSPGHLSDERVQFQGALSWRALVRYRRDDQPYRTADGQAFAAASADGLPVIGAASSIGWIGYEAGPNVHLIDPLGLSDAFLARLQTATRTFSPGHNARDLPFGYMAAVGCDAPDRIDSRLAPALRQVDIMVRGPLFAADRLLNIPAFSLGAPKTASDPQMPIQTRIAQVFLPIGDARVLAIPRTIPRGGGAWMLCHPERVRGVEINLPGGQRYALGVGKGADILTQGVVDLTPGPVTAVAMSVGSGEPVLIDTILVRDASSPADDVRPFQVMGIRLVP